jgi:hypothetical protein
MGRAMEFTVRFEGYIFAGAVRYCIDIAGAGIGGGATEQRTGEWAWFLRYPDGEWAGEGVAGSWGGMLRGIRGALETEATHGRLSYLRRDAAP